MKTEQISKEEWIALLMEARNLGLTPDEVRHFLFSGGAGPAR
ncbi:DNA-binding anti-repressor SinI [Bacillus sp. FJAT-42376]|nr:anti-repressor SinI family protein [Bacillus sp. FJAT-42376]AZB43572.1 DNA-binding anti-repressor SinI [Bacillus sp. FJAT-42376]